MSDVDFNLASRKVCRLIGKYFDHCMPSYELMVSDVVRYRGKLKSTQFSILQALADQSWYAERRPAWANDGVVQADLAKHLSLDPTTLSRAIKGLLEANHWVELADFENGSAREHVLVLTPDGREVFRKAETCWKQRNARLVKALEDAGINTPMLLKTLEQVDAVVSRLIDEK